MQTSLCFQDPGRKSSCAGDPEMRLSGRPGANPYHVAIIHAIGLILVIGYPMTYYFHLRTYPTHGASAGG